MQRPSCSLCSALLSWETLGQQLTFISSNKQKTSILLYKVKFSVEEWMHKKSFKTINLFSENSWPSRWCSTHTAIKLNYNSRISYPHDLRQTDHASCLTKNCNLSSSPKRTGNGEEKLLVILINRFSIIKGIMRH